MRGGEDGQNERKEKRFAGKGPNPAPVDARGHSPQRRLGWAKRVSAGRDFADVVGLQGMGDHCSCWLCSPPGMLLWKEPFVLEQKPPPTGGLGPVLGAGFCLWQSEGTGRDSHLAAVLSRKHAGI